MPKNPPPSKKIELNKNNDGISSSARLGFIMNRFRELEKEGEEIRARFREREKADKELEERIDALLSFSSRRSNPEEKEGKRSAPSSSNDSTASLSDKLSEDNTSFLSQFTRRLAVKQMLLLSGSQRIQSNEGSQKNQKIEQLLSTVVNKDLSRKGLSNRGGQKLEQILPEDKIYGFGAAIDNGDCFYDAIAQALNCVTIGDRKYTIKGLRSLCSTYIQKLGYTDNWVKAEIAKNRCIDDYDTHIATVQYTQEEMEHIKEYGEFYTGYAIWGKPNIEGRILASELHINLHIIEFYEIAEGIGELPPFHLLITENGQKSVEATDIDWQDGYTIHLAVYRNHFVPVIPNNPVNWKKRRYDYQLGWNCFDLAVNLNKHGGRSALVEYALANANDEKFRKLLAPEIKHAAALIGIDRDGVDANTLPSNMHKQELRDLINNYTKAHENMIDAVAKCNDALGNSDGKRIPLEELDRFFSDKKNQTDNRQAYKDFTKARNNIYVPYENALEAYCCKKEIYEQYIREYYGNNNWFAFQRSFKGEKASTSMIDIAAIMLNKIIVIYQGDEEIYRTNNIKAKLAIHVNYNGYNHFTKREEAINSQRLNRREGASAASISTASILARADMSAMFSFRAIINQNNNVGNNAKPSATISDEFINRYCDYSPPKNA